MSLVQRGTGVPSTTDAFDNRTVSHTGDVAHFFTVDVEEYFQVNAFSRHVPVERWEHLPSRVVASVDALLDMLSEAGATGTFFVLGWVASRHPHLVRRIAGRGHEIASHGWWHRKLTTMTGAEIRAELRDSRAILEDQAGQPVRGFRAPSFSIRPGMEWVFDMLLDEGYAYDSSLFPIRRPDYGYPSAQTSPYEIPCTSGVLRQYPLTTLDWRGTRFPAAGGGYLRHFPYALTRAAFTQSTRRRAPGVFYVHPWEIDPDQPHLGVPMLTRLRHRRGLRTTAGRIRNLLREFRFRSIATHLDAASTDAARAWTSTDR